MKNNVYIHSFFIYIWLWFILYYINRICFHWSKKLIIITHFLKILLKYLKELIGGSMTTKHKQDLNSAVSEGNSLPFLSPKLNTF